MGGAMEATPESGNGRVSNAIILTKLEFIAKDIDDLKTDIKGLPTRVKNLEEDVKDLENKSNGWSVLNSIGVFVAGLIAFLRGG